MSYAPWRFLFCCCGCDYFADDFDRADSTDLGIDWEEMSEDAEIYDSTLLIPGDGAVRLMRPLPWGAWCDEWGGGTGLSFLLDFDWVNIPADSDDQTLIVILGYYPELPTYYLYVKVFVPKTAVPPEPCVLSVWKREGDTHTQFKSVDGMGNIYWEQIGNAVVQDGDDINASVSYANNILCIRQSKSEREMWLRVGICPEKLYDPNADCHPGQYYLVFENGNGLTGDDVQIDNVDIDYHKWNRRDCSDCVCSCAGWPIKADLVATFEDIENCPGVDGLSVNLHHRQSPGTPLDRYPSENGYWVVDHVNDQNFPTPDSLDERLICYPYSYPLGAAERHGLQFSCSDGTMEAPGFTLTYVDLEVNSGYLSNTWTLVSYACNPIVVVFECDFTGAAENWGWPSVIFWSNGDETAGSYRRRCRITITEA